MATRATVPQEQKLSKAEAARQMATLVETHMTERGFSEAEKNERVKKFVDRVDEAIANRAK
jgi:hypothetical protein